MNIFKNGEFVCLFVNHLLYDQTEYREGFVQYCAVTCQPTVTDLGPNVVQSGYK